MASEIAHAEDSRKPSPSVREFVQQFRGLSSTVKASKICAALGVGERETLADYYRRAPDGVDAPGGDAGLVGAGQAGGDSA